MKQFPKYQDLERVHNLSWGQLIDLEPGLQQLLFDARMAGAACHSWDEVGRLFQPIRNLLTQIVGFQSRHVHHAVLGSVGAYDVAYWRLYAAVVGLLPRQVDREATSLQWFGKTSETFHSRTVESEPPVASVLPSGLSAMA
jgi:hypothetical protein